MQPTPPTTSHRRTPYRRTHRQLTVGPTALALLAAALIGCDGDDGLAPEPLEETPTEVAEEPIAPDDDETDDHDDAQADEQALRIEPGSILGPGEVTTVVGTLPITFELPEEVEGGTVAPRDVPPSLEFVVEGGAIVVFEAVGHQRDDAGAPAAARGFPDDLITWLSDQLPGELTAVAPPTDLDDGVAVTLESAETAETIPVLFWVLDEDDVEAAEGHGPPPQQTQHLWLRQLDDGWIGVVTYGPEVDHDLAEAIALSLQSGGR